MGSTIIGEKDSSEIISIKNTIKIEYEAQKLKTINTVDYNSVEINKCIKKLTDELSK